MVDAMTSERTITVLGATGSIGASTTDLLKREPGRYRVEAVTAAKNAKALAARARTRMRGWLPWPIPIATLN